MRFDEYRKYDATGLAELVAAREVTPSELLEAAIGRADEVNPKLGAVTLRHDDLAHETIRGGARDGAFTGVPFLLKDLYAMLAGTPLTNGSRLTPPIPAPYDGTLVSRFKAAGLVIFGKTASPEFGVNISTEPLLHGPCRNPYDPTRTAGGSSGGAAVAIAAGIVPMAHASDGGGSIRIPAASCGLVGLKPSRGRNPIGPDASEGWNGLAGGHVISRSVRDSAWALDAVAGPEPGDPYACPVAKRPFADEVGREGPPLRIALVTDTPLGTAIDEACLIAVKETAKHCEDLGHIVETSRLDFIRPEIAAAMVTIVQSNLATDLAFWQQMTGRDPEAHCERVTLALAARGRALSAMDLQRSIRMIQAMGRAFGRYFERYDVVLVPSLAAPPPPLGTLDQNDPDLDHHLQLVGAHIPFMPLANMTGCPAITLPLHQNDNGLPLGSMFMAPLGHEGRLIRLASALEAAHPWFDRLPPEL